MVLQEAVKLLPAQMRRPTPKAPAQTPLLLWRRPKQRQMLKLLDSLQPTLTRRPNLTHKLLANLAYCRRRPQPKRAQPPRHLPKLPDISRPQDRLRPLRPARMPLLKLTLLLKWPALSGCHHRLRLMSTRQLTLTRKLPANLAHLPGYHRQLLRTPMRQHLQHHTLVMDLRLLDPALSQLAHPVRVQAALQLLPRALGQQALFLSDPQDCQDLHLLQAQLCQDQTAQARYPLQPLTLELPPLEPQDSLRPSRLEDPISQLLLDSVAMSLHQIV